MKNDVPDTDDHDIEPRTTAPAGGNGAAASSPDETDGSSNGTSNAQPHDRADRAAMSTGDGPTPRLPFPVVGVGASAGGLEAYTELLEALPPDGGMAFVLIQHLPPQHDSMLVELLSKRTAMPVVQVEDGMRIEADAVYVIRPGHTLTMADGLLRLGESLAKPGHGRPVDDFFKSLAEEQRERAICVILSGMGSNGTAGAQEVKAVGGLCIAQEPESAKYPSMPRSLIDAGLADFVLRTDEMPAVLKQYATHPYAAGTSDPARLARRERQALAEVLTLLRTRAGHDFNGYKKGTVVRRVQRRMGLGQHERVSDYARVLRQNHAEVLALADDLQIHVTGFFRDPEAWEMLREKVIEPLVAGRDADAPIRAWITACSSGEEAYTLGILLLEAAERAGKTFDIKIFATDTAERSLSHARGGVFPGGISSEVAPERLERYFDYQDGVYVVKKELRELVVFAPQNVLQDPPFSRLDVVTCRNLLIYLEPEVQRRVLALLHFGLREGGALLLGTSETTGAVDDGFEPISKKWRLYRRVGPTRHGMVEFPLPRSLTPPEPGRPGRAPVVRPVPRAGVAQLAQHALLERHTPAAVVVDRLGQIAYYHGDTARFLDQPRGEPTRELLVLAHKGVRGALRTAMHKAIVQGVAARVADGLVETDRGRCRVEVTVAPLDQRPGNGHFLVSFAERPEPPPAQGEAGEAGDDAAEARRLRDELARVRDELQSTVEELQTSNEEMKASNEEITSVNEELQSANEEMETSKEELQSLNEELATVNAQLRAKMEELERTSSDLASLLSSTAIATIFLDTQYRIRRFTPPALELLELIPGDVGRPMDDLARKFDDPDLMGDARAVLDKLVPVEREVAGEGGRWFLRKVLPYRTLDNRINGVVITFVDVTHRRAAEQALRHSETRLKAILEQLPAGIGVVDLDGKLLLGNTAMRQYLPKFIPSRDPSQAARWRAADAEGQPLSPDQWPGTRALRGEPVRPGAEFLFTGDDGVDRWMLVSAMPFRSDEGQVMGAILVVQDVDLLKKAVAERDRFFSVSLDLLAVASMSDGRWKHVNPAMCRTLGYTRRELLAIPHAELVHPDDRERTRQASAGLAQGRPLKDFENRVRCKDGSYRWIAWETSADPATGLMYCTGRDTTDRRRADQERADLLEAERAARAQAEAANAAKDDFLANVSHELRTPLSAILLWSKMLLGERPTDDDDDSARAKTLAEGLESIERSARAQQALIEDLLDTSRIAAGKIRLQMRRIDLVAVVRAACDGIRPAADAKGVRVESDYDPGVNHVIADPERMQQIVWNLMNNAVKFTPAGGRVSLRVLRRDGLVEIVVADDGSGIAADFLPRLFERFGQADRDAGSSRSGLGLGLAITRQLVEMHGGTIAAESDGPGTGATFVVALPLPRIKDPAALQGIAPPGEAGGAADEPLAGARVLLLDADAAARSAAAAVLAKAGATVDAADSVAAALARFDANRPDLLVSDLGLANGGNALMRQIRTREARAGLAPAPAVAVGTGPADANRRAAAESGFDRYLAKPVEGDALLAALTALLAAR